DPLVEVFGDCQILHEERNGKDFLCPRLSRVARAGCIIHASIVPCWLSAQSEKGRLSRYSPIWIIDWGFKSTPERVPPVWPTAGFPRLECNAVHISLASTARNATPALSNLQYAAQARRTSERGRQPGT